MIDYARNTTTRYLYDGDNVIVDTDATGSIQRAYMHGKQYIDERAVMRSYDVDPQDNYYLLKDLYTVTGLANSNGSLAEAYVYDTYGDVTIYGWMIEDLNRDGLINLSDQLYVQGLYFVMTDATADVNYDGIINLSDALQVKDQLFNDPAVALTYSSLDNPYFFTGRELDVLAANDSHTLELQHNRNRVYQTKHGRWLQPGPLATCWAWLEFRPPSRKDSFTVDALKSHRIIQ